MIHNIQLNKNEKLTILILFMDIKRVFNHVSANKLIQICKDLELSISLLIWLRCFLNQRSIQLVFDQQKQDKTSIEIGIPQGSPVSPILFLIYIRNIFYNINMKDIRAPSYIDDIGIIVASKTVKENCLALKNVASQILQMQESHLI